MSDEQRFPTWKHALLTLLGGYALGMSACYGAMFTGDRATEGSALAFFATFLLVLAPVGWLVTIAGTFLVLTRILHALFDKKDRPPTDESGHIDD